MWTRERRAERFWRSLGPFDSLDIKAIFWQLPVEYREALVEAGVRIYRGADNAVKVEPWIPAEEFRAQNLAALDPEGAKVIETLEGECRGIEHFETLLLNAAMSEAGIEEDQIRVV